MNEHDKNDAPGMGGEDAAPAIGTPPTARARPRIEVTAERTRPAAPMRSVRDRRPAPRLARGVVAPSSGRRAEGRSMWTHPVFRLALLGMGLLLVVALFMDLRGALRRSAVERDRLDGLERPEAMLLGIEDRRYVDPLDRFALTTPVAWTLSGPAPDNEFAVLAFGPRKLELRVVINELPHDRFDLLLASIRGKEDRLEVAMNIRRIEFQGRPAVERQARLHRTRLYMLDFLDGRTAHHLLVSVPHEDYDAMLPIVREVLQTYEVPPGRLPPPESD